MVRHYCHHSEEMFLCIAESRGDSIDCDNCPLNEDLDSKATNKKSIAQNNKNKNKQEIKE